MKTFLAYYLVTTGACIVLDSVAINALVNKINRRLEDQGYEPLSTKNETTKTKESVSEKAVRWIKAIPAFTIPIVRFLVPAFFIAYGDKLAEKSTDELIYKKKVTKKEENMSYSERIDAIEAKKAELAALKRRLSNNGVYNFDDTDLPAEGYVAEKRSKTL